MPAGIWEDIWTKSLLARVYRFITQFRFRMTRDKVTLLMDESDNLCRRLHQCCVACRCFKRCHWQTSSKLCWRIWMLGSEDDRFLLASVSFTLYLSLLTFPFPSSRFFACVLRGRPAYETVPVTKCQSGVFHLQLHCYARASWRLSLRSGEITHKKMT